MTRLFGTLLGLAIAAAVPAAAQADSIVYLKGDQVWISTPDGQIQRQFTQHAYNWASPSESDDGTVVVAGGLSRINADGSDSDGSSEIYRFQPDGNQIGSSTPTWGSRSTPACPAYPPSRVRVSPDGSKIAYGIYGCGDGGYQTALWTPAGSTGLNFPNQTLGQQDFWNPIWIDSSRFAVSHSGPPTFGGAHWGEHLVTDGDNIGGGWTEPTMTDREADVVISRDGKTAVAFFEDGFNYLDGVPRNVSLFVYHNDAVPSDWTHNSYGAPVCQYDITPASDFADIEHLDPSLSPDGTKLLYGDKDGVEVMSLGDVTNHCANAGDIVTLIPGGSQPFYSKGNLQPGAANPQQPAPPAPAPTPSGSTPTPTPPATPTATPAAPVAPTPTTAPTVGRLIAKFRVATKAAKVRRGKKVTFDARGSSESGGRVVSYSWSFGDKRTGKGGTVTHTYRKAGKYTVTLAIRDALGRKATVRQTVRVRR